MAGFDSSFPDGKKPPIAPDRVTTIGRDGSLTSSLRLDEPTETAIQKPVLLQHEIRRLTGCPQAYDCLVPARKANPDSAFSMNIVAQWPLTAIASH
ncbi:hypothetical protein [Pelagibacterium lentulum]|uniref:hypothetical protein n=1 Tax=Pelagibacterium lentulum TaxID=2029865 RepID=UPI000F8E32B0|nr:hypothetical protein [Pelagibacterium lentulum]